MDDVIRSNIGRVVAFVVTPILLPVVGAFAVWLQDVAGINLNPTETTAYIAAVVAGVGLVAYKWLANRGEWERAVVTVKELHDMGEAEAMAAGDETAEDLGTEPARPAAVLDLTAEGEAEEPEGGTEYRPLEDEPPKGA
jgi:hypothetical protein